MIAKPMPSGKAKRSHKSYWDRVSPSRSARRVHTKGNGLVAKWPEPQGQSIIIADSQAVTGTGEPWNMRHAGLMRKYHFWPYKYAEIASRFEDVDPFDVAIAPTGEWQAAKDAWYAMWRIFFLDTTMERGPRNDWILPDDVYPPLPRVPPWIVQAVEPAFGWPQFMAQIDEQLEAIRGWQARPTGQLIEVQVLKPPQKIRSQNEDGGRKIVDYQQLLYRLSQDFLGQMGNTVTWSMMMQAVMYKRFDANIVLLPSLGIEWLDFGAGVYEDTARNYIVALVNLVIAHMRYVYAHLQERDLTDTEDGGFGGLVGNGGGHVPGSEPADGFSGSEAEGGKPFGGSLDG